MESHFVTFNKGKGIMHTSFKRISAATVAAFCIAGTTAQAEDLDDRRYMGVLGSYVVADTDNRGALYQYDDGYGISLLLGSQKSETVNTEFSLAYTVLEGDRNGVTDAHDWQITLGYDWLYFFDREGWQPFGPVSYTHLTLPTIYSV